jgi:Fe-S cluster assembly protein SufD
MLTNTLNANFSAVSHYCDEYQRVAAELPGHNHESLQSLRKTALAHVSALGFPTKKQADWKYTPLTSFLQTPFSINPNSDSKALSAILETSDNPYRLVFLNGHFSPSLSKISTLPDQIVLSDLAAQIKNNPEHLVNHWKKSTEQPNSFIHLNSAFIQDGAYLYLPANTTLTSPIELIFVNSGEQSFIPIRNLIIAEENSRAVIIEKYISLKEKATTYFSNTVTECFLSTQSHIEHYKLTEESKKSTHIGNLCATQQANSQFFSYSIALSGGLVRSDTQVKLEQAQAQCHLKGLSTAQEKQHIAHHTVIDHRSPDTHSKQFYKGVVNDKASAVFNGKVIIRPQAIKSKAEQLNKNLLLSPHAEVNTKPQLEIFVDDIQCTHGASIGQLDDDALFYLRARGVNASEARQLLIKAFIQDIIQQMPLLRTHTSFKYLLAGQHETV